MQIHYDPYAIISLLAGGITCMLMIFIWVRSPGRYVIPYIILSIGIIIWSVLGGLEILAQDFDTKHTLVKLYYLGIVLVPLGWFLFVVQHTGYESWINRRNLLLLTIHPLITLMAIWTNDQHHQFWAEIVWDAEQGIAAYSAGPLFWLHSIYSYILLFSGAILLIGAFIRAPQLYRGQMTLLLIAQFGPWVANALYITRTAPLPDYVDPTPLAFTITNIAIAWSLYRFRLMDLIPVAHRVVFNSMNDAVFVIDLKRRVVDANQIALGLLNKSSTSVIGQSTVDVFADYADLAKRFRDVDFADEEIKVLRNDEELTFQIRLSPLRDQGGNITGRIIVLHDITEIKQTLVELQQARIKADESAHLKSEFLATVSHELRTPLNAILGYSELILEGMIGDLDEEFEGPISRIAENGRYLLTMINDILDLSKIEAGHVEIHEIPVDLPELMFIWERRISVLAENKKVKLSFQTDADMPREIYADGERLTQIVFNLLSNAVKFTDSGAVSLNVEQAPEDRWRITVKDSGSGIPAEALQYIFDEFRQVNPDHLHNNSGSGLGLAIVSKLTTLMNGKVWVESKEGEGSSFFVELPLRPVTSQDADVEETNQAIGLES